MKHTETQGKNAKPPAHNKKFIVFRVELGSRIQPVYWRRGERSELRLQYYGLEKCDKQRLKPHQRRCVLLISGRVAVKILLQSTIGLEVITLCCLITVPPARWLTRVWLSPWDRNVNNPDPTSEAMTIRVQQATPYTCLRTCDCSTLCVEWSWTL